jgi:hypothetical protein
MNQQLQNLYALLDTGERILANPLACALGFGRVDCGTYACLIGWHVRYDHSRRDLLTEWGGMNCQNLRQHFGISDLEMDYLFGSVDDLNEEHGAELDRRADKPGPEAYQELRCRIVYLRDLIANREAELGVEPRAQSAAA